MPLALLKSEISNPAPAADPLSDLNDDQRRQVGHRLSLVVRYEQMVRDFVNAGRRKQEAREVFLATNPGITKSTLYAWLAAYKSDGVAGLVDRRSAPNSRTVEQSNSPSIGPAAWQRFLDLWLTPHQRTVSLCYQIVQAEAEEHRLETGDRRPEAPPASSLQPPAPGSSPASSLQPPASAWAWPSLRTVQAAVQRLPRTQVDYHRLGEKEWRRRHSPHVHRDYEAVRPGEHWVADFHQFDIFCRRSESDPTIVRPLLSAWLDIRSRCMTGWDIGERECQDAVLLAFRKGVEAYGPPQQVTIDNGKPYRAQGVSGGRPSSQRKIGDEAYVRSVFAGLNVGVHFSIPYNPDSKPIEGWFGQMEQQFGKTFDTYCSGDLKSECFRRANDIAKHRPELCPTVDQLRESFGLWLEAYHATPHGAADLHGLSPNQAYGLAPLAPNSRTVEQSNSLSPIPRAILPDGSLDVLLLRTTKAVKVGQYGVVHNGVQYGMTDARLQRMHGQEVTLRIDPIDASYVIVCDLQGRPLMRVINNRLALNEIDQDHIAAGQRAKGRARRLAKEIREGGLRPAMQDVTSAAIAAKHKAAQAMQQLMRATGTDDSEPAGSSRRSSPLRSDFADAMKTYKGSGFRVQGSEISNLKSEIGPASMAEIDFGPTDQQVDGPTDYLSLADALEGES